MANSNVEIEIRFPLINFEKAKEYLDKKAKLISQKVFQKDTYYVPVHRDFLKSKYVYEWLRIRESQKGKFLTYKHFHPENVKITDYCDEYESKVENIDAIYKIFEALDMKEVIVVEKYRNIWMYKDVEISVDVVTNLGSFIELEVTKNFKDKKEGKKYLREILDELKIKVGEEDTLGYPFMLLMKQGYIFDK